MKAPFIPCLRIPSPSLVPRIAVFESNTLLQEIEAPICEPENSDFIRYSFGSGGAAEASMGIWDITAWYGTSILSVFNTHVPFVLLISFFLRRSSLHHEKDAYYRRTTIMSATPENGFMFAMTAAHNRRSYTSCGRPYSLFVNRELDGYPCTCMYGLLTS